MFMQSTIPTWIIVAYVLITVGLLIQLYRCNVENRKRLQSLADKAAILAERASKGTTKPKHAPLTMPEDVHSALFNFMRDIGVGIRRPKNTSVGITEFVRTEVSQEAAELFTQTMEEMYSNGRTVSKYFPIYDPELQGNSEYQFTHAIYKWVGRQLDLRVKFCMQVAAHLYKLRYSNMRVHGTHTGRISGAAASVIITDDIEQEDKK